MTAGRADVPLSVDADAVAEAIVDAVAKGSDLVWVPGALRAVMSGLRHVPRPLFRRLPRSPSGHVSASGHVVPASGHVLPANGHVLPANGHVLPANGHVVPVTWVGGWFGRRRRAYESWVGACLGLSGAVLHSATNETAEPNDPTSLGLEPQTGRTFAHRVSPLPSSLRLSSPNPARTQAAGNNATVRRKNATARRKNVTARGNNVTARRKNVTARGNKVTARATRRAGRDRGR